jgi:hypothetical protein
MGLEMRFLSIYVLFVLACGVPSHAFACSPSRSYTEFVYGLDAVALDEKSRTDLATSLAHITKPGADLERVEVMVWRNASPKSITDKNTEQERLQARTEYLRALLVRLGSPLNVVISNVGPEVALDELSGKKLKAKLNLTERAEISIVHYKPCQCRINLPRLDNEVCRNY